MPNSGDFSTTATPIGGEPWSFLQPPVIPGYLVHERIGEGGMGAVYRAEQLKPKRQPGEPDVPLRTVAIKVVLGSGAGRAAIDNLWREGEKLARVGDANIIALHAIGEFDVGSRRYPYLAMEYFPGLPLDKYIVLRQPSVSERLDLLRQISHALSTAHARGVVHRDLKPRNILVDDNKRLKVLDFGVGAWLEEIRARTSPERMGGTIPFMSPEQAVAFFAQLVSPKLGVIRQESRAADGTLVLSESRPMSEASEKSDQYSLAVVAYWLLSQTLPYPHDTVWEDEQSALGAIRGPRPTTVPNASRKVSGVILKAMSIDQDRRYDSIAEFLSDLERARVGRMTAPEPRTLVNRIRSHCIVHRVPLAIAAALAVGLVGTTWQSIEANQQRRAAEVLAQQKAALAQSEEAARVRAEGLATSTDRAMEFIEQVLFSVDSYNVRDQRLNWDYVFSAAQDKLPTVQGDARARAITLRAMGRIAMNWGRKTEGAEWLQQAADLWRELAEAPALTDRQRKDESLQFGQALNWLAWAQSGVGKKKEAVLTAEESYKCVAAQAGAMHQDALAYRFDFAKMRIDSGDWVAGAVEFIDTLALIDGKEPAEYVKWLINQNHRIADLTRQGKFSEAEEQLRGVLQPFLDSSRPRIRTRTPWSLSQASEWMALRSALVAALFSQATQHYKLGSDELPTVEDLAATGKLAVEVAAKLAKELKPSGHPDIGKTQAVRNKVLPGSGS